MHFADGKTEAVFTLRNGTHTTRNFPGGSGSQKPEVKCLCGGGRKRVVEMLSYPQHPHPGETLARSEERQCRALP